MRIFALTLLMAVTISLGGAVSAGKKTPTTKEKFLGTWTATFADKKHVAELGTFTFRDDGKFTLEREHFLDLAKGTYAVEGDAFKITVAYAVDGAPMVKGPWWPTKIKSVSEKEIVLEIQDKANTVPIHLTRVPVPEGALQRIEQDRKKLQGSWEYVRTEKDGKLFKEKGSAGTLTFKGEKILEAGTKEYGIFTLSATRKLKAIQFRFSNGEGLAVLGAYELDGDTLRICRDRERAFPAEFKTKGTTSTIDEFKRVTK